MNFFKNLRACLIDINYCVERKNKPGTFYLLVTSKHLCEGELDCLPSLLIVYVCVCVCLYARLCTSMSLLISTSVLSNRHAA